MKFEDCSYVIRTSGPPSHKQLSHFVVHAPSCRYHGAGKSCTELVKRYRPQQLKIKAGVGSLAPCKVCKPDVWTLTRALCEPSEAGRTMVHIVLRHNDIEGTSDVCGVFDTNVKAQAEVERLEKTATYYESFSSTAFPVK